MLFVYGSLMPLRLLEEIRFWKTQEKEHTVVIRTLVPNLEPVYVKALQEWEAVFEKTEMVAGQWIEWTIRTQQLADPQLHNQLNHLLQSSTEQSNAFIQLLFQMEQQSVPVRTNPIVQTVVEHIIRESEYFLGVLKAMGGSSIYDPILMPSPHEVSPGIYLTPYPHSIPSFEQADPPHSSPMMDRPGGSSFSRQIEEQEEERQEETVLQPTSTGEGSWSAMLPHRKPVPIGGHKLPPLPYAYDALEPFIDTATMQLHHDKHHKSYVDGLNKAETMLAKARESGDFDLVKHWERELAFHGAGHYLHTIFWNTMSPKGGGPATGAIAAEIEKSFGSFDRFKKQFSAAADKVEGGGWAILVWSPRSHRLEILQAEKHQNLSQWDVVPLLPLDVWEHAYYLKYGNERAKYVDNWWRLVNWDDVNARFAAARNLKWPPY